MTMNHVWAYNFVFDTCANGQTLKCRARMHPAQFLQHRLSERGHRNLLVTHTLLGRPPKPYAERPPRQRLRSNAIAATEGSSASIAV